MGDALIQGHDAAGAARRKTDLAQAANLLATAPAAARRTVRFRHLAHLIATAPR